VSGVETPFLRFGIWLSAFRDLDAVGLTSQSSFAKVAIMKKVGLYSNCVHKDLRQALEAGGRSRATKRARITQHDG